jgi:hypothetical protein
MGGAAGAIAGGAGSALGGAGGSMKGSKGRGSQTSEAATQLIDLFSNMYSEGKELRGEISDQFMNILKTGGSNAINPSMRAAEHASRRAGALAVQRLQEDQLKTGTYGSSFGRAELGSLKAENMFRSSQVGPQMQYQFIQQMLPLISNYSSGQTGTVAQALGAAVQGNVKSKDRTTPTKTSFLGMGG